MYRLVRVTVHSAATRCATAGARPLQERLPPPGRGSASLAKGITGATTCRNWIRSHRPGVASGPAGSRCARSAAGGAARSINLSSGDEPGTTVIAASTSQHTTPTVTRLRGHTRRRPPGAAAQLLPLRSAARGGVASGARPANERRCRAFPLGRLGRRECVTECGPPSRRARARLAGHVGRAGYKVRRRRLPSD